MITPAYAQTKTGADAVLQKFVGKWRTHLTITRPKSPLAVIESSGTGTGQIILGGQYLEYRAIADPKPRHSREEDLQINTLDKKCQCYRHWLYDSEGNRFSRIGYFDKLRQTLTWTAHEMGGTILIHDRFVHPDRIEWDMIRRDSKGRVTLRIDAWMNRLP
jgi:hypothetical protein